MRHPARRARPWPSVQRLARGWLLQFHTAMDVIGLTRLNEASYLSEGIVVGVEGMTDVQRLRGRQLC